MKTTDWMHCVVRRLSDPPGRAYQVLDRYLELTRPRIAENGVRSCTARSGRVRCLYVHGRTLRPARCVANANPDTAALACPSRGLSTVASAVDALVADDARSA